MNLTPRIGPNLNRQDADFIQDANRAVRVALPGTCGELAQGTLDGTPCLVSCPIDLFSVAALTLRSKTGWDTPADAPKAAAALQSGLKYLETMAFRAHGHCERSEATSSTDCHCERSEAISSSAFDKRGAREGWHPHAGPGLGGELMLHSPLPRGRGYASSTADVGAALYALGEALGRPLDSTEAARLAVGVEPSDSTLFEGLALFDHRRGSFYRLLGSAPPLTVIVLDPGGEVDTLRFNRDDHRRALRRLAAPHREAFETLVDGLERGDWAAVGYATTLSAQCHQAILPNPLLDHALKLARQVSALGVCRAHSGTILGVLLSPDRMDAEEAARFLSRALATRQPICPPGGVTVSIHRLVDGGPRILEETDECWTTRDNPVRCVDRPAVG